MRRYPLALLAALLVCLVGDHAIVAQNAGDLCPPAYRKDPVATRRAIEAKKAELRRRGFPERFLHLLDAEQCPKCVQIASDSFHIMVVYNDDENAPTDSKGRRWTHHTFGWDPQSERQVREELAAGKIKAFYIMNTATRCDCCPEVNDYHTPDMYDDWNKDLEVNMSHVIPFESPNALGPLPPDLENPPDGWTRDVPDIVRVQKPPKRYVHVLCPACEPLANQWNSAADTLDYLWREKMSLLYGISITENAIATRENQISHLEYQQLFASSRTDARQQQIDMLKRVNDAQREDIAYDERRIQRYDESIKEYEDRMAALMKQIIDCENACKARTATPPSNAATPTVTPAPPPTPAVTPAPTPTRPNAPPPADNPNPAVVAKCAACRDAADRLNRAQAALDADREALNAVILQDALNLRQADAIRRERQGVAGQPASPERDARLKALDSEFDKTIDAMQSIVGRERDLEKEVASERDNVESLQRALDECNRRCDTAANTARADSCVGASCTPAFDVGSWASCGAGSACLPPDSDPFIPGNFPAGHPPGAPFVDLFDNGAWTTSINIEIEVRVQDKVAEFDPANYPQWLQDPGTALNQSVPRPDFYSPYITLPPQPQQQVRQWFNPLGLLARNLLEHVDRWRASLGPRPLIRARDLETIDRASNIQAAGLPKGVHVMMADQGGSTGKTLVMSVLNLSGQPVRLASKPFAVQPIKQQAQQQVMQAFNRLSKAAPVNLSLSAYCVEMLKAPPGPSTILRLAPANVQQKYASMSKILQSSYRVAKANALHPDSNRAAYTDSIKQWALWTAEQNFNQARFADAFVAHTKKNVEAAGQKWPQEADAAVRKAAPNRWRDIVTILKGAGLPVPQ